ncbi:MAG: IS21 family transposase [bacterium]
MRRRTGRRRLMDRKIVEQLRAGASMKHIVRTLHVGKNRVRRVREQGREYGYLDEAGKKGPAAVPPYPEALFPDPVDGRSLKVSASHALLKPHHGWITERLEAGWYPITLFEELPSAINVTVSRSSFYRYLDRHKLNRLGESYRVVPEIVHKAGEALILDWGKLRDVIDPETGKKRTLWFFAGVLGYSRYLMVRLVWKIDVETTLRELESMLREIGGVPVKLTIDNPKCIALEASLYQPVLHPATERFAAHYGTLIEALPPGAPKLKGKIERCVPYVRRLYQAHGDAWHGIEESQLYLDRKLGVANERRHGTTQRRPREVFAAEESQALKNLPAVAYEVEQFSEATVRKDGHVRFANKYYSVDEWHIGEDVIVLGDSKLVSIYRKGKLLEVHNRITDPNIYKSTKPHHMKPWERAMQDGSFYRERAQKLGPHVDEVVLRLLKQGYGFIDFRQIWGILNLDKNYPAHRIEAACQRALDRDSADWRTVKTILEVEEAMDFEARRREASKQSESGIKTKKSGYKYVRPLSVYKEQLSLLLH